MCKMVFTVIGAVAELERSLIRERVVMGLDLLMPHKSRLDKLFRVVHSRWHEHTESDQTRSVGA